LAEVFLKQYPANAVFLRARADILFQASRWQDAAEAYGRALTALKEFPTQSQVEELECYYKQGIALKMIDKKRVALKSFQQATATKTPAWANSQVVSKRQDAAKWIEKLNQ